MADKKPFRWSDDALTQAGEQVVWMSPEDYLALSPALKGKPFEAKSGKDLLSSVDSGEEVNGVPSLTLKKGMVTGQDGRHRAILAKESGVKMIPVKLSGDEIATDREIMGMQGKKVKLQGRPRVWEDVVKDPEFRKLPVEDREAARKEYFDQVVAPRLSAADLEEARTQFETDTRPRRAPRNMPLPTAAEGGQMAVEGMGAGQRFAASFGRTIPQAAQATGKLGRDVLEGVLGGGEPGSTPGSQPIRTAAGEAPPIGEKVANFLRLPNNQDVRQVKERDAPLLATPAGAVGDVARNLAYAAPLAMMPGGATVLGATGYGAALPLVTQPAESWGERGEASLTSGLTSGGTVAGVRAAPALWRSFGAPLTSGGRDRMALDTIERFAKDPNALRNWSAKPAPPGAPAIDELIPGSRATLAEVTGDPGIAQAQRVVHAASPDAANEIASMRTSRIQARKNALIDKFGIGNKEALEATRESVAERMYKKAWDKPIEKKAVKENAADMKELLARPSIQRARKSALELAKEEGEVLSANDLKGGSVKGLHYMKKALDSEISVAKRAGDDNQARVLMGTKRKLMDVVDKLSPEYKKANEEFAKRSKPINQAEVGSYLYDKLFPALSDVGAERMSPAQFAKVLKEGNAMAKKATGFSGAKLKDILSTEQWNTVINLAKDVGREVGAIERGKVPGSPTAQYLSGRNVLRQMLGPVGLPDSWSEKVAADLLHNKWTSMIATPVERSVQNRLATMLADPRAAAIAQAKADAARAGRIPQAANALTRYALPPAAGTLGLTSSGGQ